MLLAALALSLSWLFLDATPAAAESDSYPTGVVASAASYWPTGAIANLVPSGAAVYGVYGLYGNWATPDAIYFYPGPTDILNVVTVSEWPLSLTVTPFNTSTYSAGATRTILLPDFPLWGGFYAAPDGNFYVVTGQWNSYEDDSLSVVAVRKYDSSWSLTGTGYLKGGASQGIKGVYAPFEAGSCAMWLTGTRLVVHTSRLMYAIGGLNHQGNMTFEVNTSSMAVTPFEDGYGTYSYSSHSFNQLVSGSDTDLVVADHGDAYPRAIQVGVAHGYPTGAGSFASYDVFALLGSIGANYTGTTLTGLQVGSGRALVTGNSVPHNHAIGGVTGDAPSRNVYVVSTDLATGTPVFRWITSYNPFGTTWAGEPRMVKLSESRFVLLFSVMTSTSETLNYRLLDESGAVLAQKSWANVSFDASSQPLGVGSRLYWAGFGMSPSGGSMENYYLYGVDLTDPTAPTLMTLPPPTVTALSLSSGSGSGGTAVTIAGTNFNGVTAVTFGGTAATSFRVDSATQVTAIAPPHAAGTVAVQVTTMVDSSADTPADDFTYIATTRYQQSGTVITYLGDWSTVATWSASGGSMHSTSTAGAAVIVEFTGDSIWLVGKTAPWYGKALVSVDGGPEEYADFYSTTEFYKRAVYTKAGLGAGTHTLVMRCTREKNLASSAYTISLDALDVTGALTQAEAPQGYQQNDPNFQYDGAWVTTSGNASLSGGSFASVNGPGSAVNIAFNGTGTGAYLAWYAKKGPGYGMARVILDKGTPQRAHHHSRPLQPL
jgi:hypothetical protein